MKQTITIVRDDGSGGKQSLESKGRGGDDRLAHVNRWEEMLLKKLGGAGSRNPNTGLKEFYPTQTRSYIGSRLNPTKTTTPTDTLSYLSSRLNPVEPTATTSTQDYLDSRVNPVASASTTGTGTDMFNIPLDIMPTSESTSYSGLPGSYRDSLLSSLMPQLQTAVQNMPQNYDDYTNQALGSYQQMLNNALKKNIPKALATMANRGILNSTEGNEIMRGVMSDAAMGASTKGYETAMQAALLKANMPSILGELAKLGASSGSYSQTSDPTVMYRTMASLIQSMMG